MAEEKQTRTRRTTEERIAEIEAKIKAEDERHNAQIQKFQGQIKRLKKPKLTKAQRNKKILDALKKKYTGDELVAKLGESVEELLGEAEGKLQEASEGCNEQ